MLRLDQGEEWAFEELVRRTYGDLYGLAFRMTGNADDACDVVQDAYLRAYKSRDTFRGEATVTTWLYRIVANCASSHVSRRSRNRHQRLEDSTPVVDDRPSSDPETMADVALERRRLGAAMASLPPRLRMVVVLKDVYDLPHEAIAAELGITEAAAKVRLHRGRRKLRERLYGQRRQ